MAIGVVCDMHGSGSVMLPILRALSPTTFPVRRNEEWMLMWCTEGATLCQYTFAGTASSAAVTMEAEKTCDGC
jgi:hypothetical protein